MKHARIATFVLAWIAASAGPQSLAVTMDFESVPSGTAYGGAFGQTPGDVVLSQDGIAMSVEDFFLGTFTGFIKAEVGGLYDDFFPTTPLSMDNIAARFDFADVGFDVTVVTLEYQEFGGADNFAVNDFTLYELGSLNDLPVAVAPGITASVVDGVITLTGPVDSFQIGGQELAIDNVAAIPEPASILLLGLGAAAFLKRPRGQAHGGVTTDDRVTV